MCAICVEIIRERIQFRDAIGQYKEMAISTKTAYDAAHAAEILEADAHQGLDKVVELVTDGYKKERWL